MCYIELKNDKYETLEDLKHLLQYILRLDKTAEDSQRALRQADALNLKKSVYKETVTSGTSGGLALSLRSQYLLCRALRVLMHQQQDITCFYRSQAFSTHERHSGRMKNR